MTALSASEVAAQVRAGQRTAIDVVEDSLARIYVDDPRIGAFQYVDPEGARRAAAALDQRADRSGLPLAGVPVAIKDNVAVAGIPTRHGSGATSTEPEATDDELVVRLRKAGAIVVGKTRLPELAIWGFTESIALGGTRNPHDPRRNAGGSTGGGAAAVAAGMVPLALGSDGGGSLRIPSGNCGVIGFKPGLGTVPLAGGLEEHWYGCSAFGPIATTVPDIILAMDALTERSWQPPDPGRLRVAVASNRPTPIGRPDATASSALHAAVKAVRALGHEIHEARIPYPRSLASTWISCWHAGIAEEVDRLGLPMELLEPRTQRMVRYGHARVTRYGPNLDPVRAAMSAWRAAATEFLAPYDVLLTPTIARPAPRFGWGERAGYQRAVLNGARGTPYTQAWNVAGLPAMSLPYGRRGRLPGAVQLIVAPGKEPVLLALAEQLLSSTVHVGV
jgi:amidase